MKKRYRVKLTERQRIGALAAIHHWKAAGCPIPPEFKRTHAVSARDAIQIENALNQASVGPLHVVLTIEGGNVQSVDSDAPEDLAITSIDFDSQAQSSDQGLGFSDASVNQLPVRRNKRLVDKVRSAS